MRIVIDMQGAQTGNRFRGIGRYTLALSRAIIKNRDKHEVILALNGAFPDSVNKIREDFSQVLPRKSIRVWHPLTQVAQLAPESHLRQKLNEYVRDNFLASLSPDIVLVSSHFEGWGDDAVTTTHPCENNYITATIVYDLIPYIHQSIYLANDDFKRWYLEKLSQLSNSNLWLTISESSKQESVNYLGLPSEKCINISSDSDEQFRKVEMTDHDILKIKKRHGIHNKFIMYTGGIDHRKNIEGLIRSYSLLSKELRKDHQLVVVCSAQDTARNKLCSLALEHGLRETEFILTGFISEEDLISLYNCCSLFVFPSWHEGFGLPVLEAMRCGAPVIASNISSLPEVIGIQEALFDPHSDQAIALIIERALSDKDFKKRLIRNSERQSKNFSWDFTAKRAIDAMEYAFAEKNKKQVVSTHPKKPKLAYISPLPPERSGIAIYSAELLPTLSEYYQIEVITDQDEISDYWIQKNCVVRRSDWFIKHSNDYDRVLYHFGNSHYHQHMFSMLQTVPGVVVLHDFYLSGVAYHMQASLYAPGFFEQQLYHSHGYSALQKLAKTDNIIDIITQYPMSREVLENSVGCIVHSKNSVQLVQQWYHLSDSILKVIPLARVAAKNTDKGSARQALGFTDDDFIVCSFGFLAPTKLNHKILQSWFDSALSNNQACHLVFVGENPSGDYGNTLTEDINNSSCAARIHITGWASTEKFEQYLAAADIGVQLRSMSRGETSATVLDCMNYGLPTIVNAHGSMAELDQETVYMLPDKFNTAELSKALESLWFDPVMREKLAERAKSSIINQHNPTKCAKNYAEAIEGFYQKNTPYLFNAVKSISKTINNNFVENDLTTLAHNLNLTFPPNIKQKQLLVDISELVYHSKKTEILSVVQNILQHWLNTESSAYRIEPVYTAADGIYKYARNFVINFLNISNVALLDDPVDYGPDDIFFVLDFNPQTQINQRGFYKNLQNHGVKVFFTVYDLLYTKISGHFSDGTKEDYKRWLNTLIEGDGAFCISKSVSSELLKWIEENEPEKLKRTSVNSFYLGSDIENPKPPKQPSKKELTILAKTSTPSFLMIGTLDLGEGYLQVLDAFEFLWKQENEISLIVVAKQGQTVESLNKRLQRHPELNKRLFWLESISDEFLEEIYASCSCLIAASHNPCFNLDLIKAAQWKLPILARDTLAFREVAGAHASYFSSDKAEELAESIEYWLELYKKNQHPRSDKIPQRTWKESAQNLLDLILDINSQCKPSNHPRQIDIR